MAEGWISDLRRRAGMETVSESPLRSLADDTLYDIREKNGDPEDLMMDALEWAYTLGCDAAYSRISKIANSNLSEIYSENEPKGD